MTTWAAELDRLAPASCAESPEETRRGRLFVTTVLTLALASGLFAFLAYQSNKGVDAVSGLLALGALLAASNIVIGRVLNELRPVAILICVEHIVLVSLVGYFGSGPGDTSQWWLAPAPIVAAFLLGPRAGVMSAVAASLTRVWHFVAAKNGHVFLSPDADYNFFATASPITVFLALAGLAWVYEQSRLRGVALVEETLVRLQQANDELARVAQALTATRDEALAENKKKTVFIDEMRGFSRSHTAALERSRKSTERMNATIKSIAASVDTLAKAASTSDVAIDNVASSAGEMSTDVTTLVGAVDETDGALRALRAAVDNVQRSLQPLREQATSTATAMTAMERSAATVEESAQRTAALASTAISDAVRGAEAARRSGLGIEEIKVSAVTVSAAMGDLVKELDEIDRILAVIEDVTVETNVLALNASILAAQAGEDGRGFGVVAEQIKALAARTATNTRASGVVVDQVKSRARLAERTLSRAVSAVDAGLALSQDASLALDQIVKSASEAESMARGIEGRTREQVEHAQRVVTAMTQVLREVERATQSASDHSRTAQQIESAMRRIKALTPEVARRADSQTESSRAVRAAIAQVNEMAQRLANVQGEQSRAAEDALGSADALHRAQTAAAAAIEALSFERRSCSAAEVMMASNLVFSPMTASNARSGREGQPSASPCPRRKSAAFETISTSATKH